MSIEEAKKKIATEYGYTSFVELIKQESTDIIHIAIRKAINLTKTK